MPNIVYFLEKQKLHGFQVKGMKVFTYEGGKHVYFFTVFLFVLCAFTFKLYQDINNIRCMVMECPKLGSLKIKTVYLLPQCTFFQDEGL